MNRASVFPPPDASVGVEDEPFYTHEPPTLRELALSAVAHAAGALEVGSLGPESQQLHRWREAVGTVDSWSLVLQSAIDRPHPGDQIFGTVGRQLRLSPIEILAVALAMGVEKDLLLGRLLARLQAPIGGARPTVGLLQSIFANDPEIAHPDRLVADLVDGPAGKCGLLVWVNEAAPLPERSLLSPLPIALALSGQPSQWPGIRLGRASVLDTHFRLPPSMSALALAHARTLAAQASGGLLIRSDCDLEARTAANELAEGLEQTAAFIETDRITGLGVWLTLRRLLPVFPCELAPGERRRLAPLPGYTGPLIALAGTDGSVEFERSSPVVWTLGIPGAAERTQLWRESLQSDPTASDAPPDTDPASAQLSQELGAQHRHGAGRIAQLGAMARREASLHSRTTPTAADIAAAAWSNDGLETLAEPIRVAVPDAALVVPDPLRREMRLLIERCRARDRLADQLGASAQVRYRPGVRALFVGPSGCGKTLAAGWLATQLQLPLYRVDLANVTSKYIGETEKNLARLLARAEQAEVILLFDEADSLFGKRTEIRDSNDRFANAQTNYLLQRLETYEGLVVLTSNSKARFDAAFARRLDVVLEFTLPTPEERRALWQAHLGGEASDLTVAELNQLAAQSDLAGGHIRNAVLTAALHAGRSRKIRLADCLAGLASEYGKIGRQLPGGWQVPPT